MRNDVLAVGLGEDEVDVGSMICPMYLYFSRVLLSLGGGASLIRFE